MRKYIFNICVLLISFFFFSCKKEFEKDLIYKSKLVELQGVKSEFENVIPTESSPFPFCQEDPNPIGGGAGYNDIISVNGPHTYYISNPDPLNFINTVKNAVSGDIIFIDPHVSIDLTDIYVLTGNVSQSIKIQDGVTIASNRGENGSLGALIFATKYTFNGRPIASIRAPIFKIDGDNVRITGLRLRGPSGSFNKTSEGHQRLKMCIANYKFKGLIVDNCELFNWPEAAIRIGGSTVSSIEGNVVKNNYIHNNSQDGWGYGIVLNSGFSKVYSNVFKENRHDITSSGKPKSGYEASCNTFYAGYGPNCDIHSEGGESDSDPETQNAGKFFHIHHNDFKDKHSLDSDNGFLFNIGVRGRPDVQCRVENNRFKHDGPTQAIGQGYYNAGSKSYGNMLIWNNIYNISNYLGWYVKSNWSSSNPNNYMNVYSNNSNTSLNTNDYNSSIFGVGTELYIEDCRIQIPYSPPQNLMRSAGSYSINFGDYDGIGGTDIFKLENGVLYTMPFIIQNNLPSSDPNSGYQVGWTPILYTNYSMSELRFGFFDGDNKTDVIVKSGNDLLISKGCNSPWQVWNNTSYSLLELRFGDFNGDGQTDLFKSIANWGYSDAGSSSWISLNTSVYTYNDLRLGLFNRNTLSDVFLADGSNFQVSFEGTGSWRYLIPSSFITNSHRLKVFDFNGDGVSDVLNDFHQVSLGGINAWIPTTTNSISIANFPYGDF